MKKILILLLCIALQKTYAQVYESKIDYNKITQAAVINEYKYPEEIVLKTVKDKMEHMGYKINNSKGFLIISNAVISSISSKPMDYIFKVERKSKQQKDITVVSVITNENLVNTTVENNAKLKSFLTDLTISIDAVNTDFMVNEQYDLVVKSQKKMKNLQNDQASLEKKIRNLQDDLKKNAKDQEDQQKEITRQQEVLDAFKAKKTGA